jgi:hypothetical protein
MHNSKKLISPSSLNYLFLHILIPLHLIPINLENLNTIVNRAIHTITYIYTQDTQHIPLVTKKKTHKLQIIFSYYI